MIMDRLCRRAPHSCPWCRSFLVDTFELPPVANRVREGHGYYYGKRLSYEQVFEAAEDGCPFFQQTLSRTTKETYTMRPNLHYYKEQLLHFNYEWDSTQLRRVQSGYWSVTAVEGDPVALEVPHRPLVTYRRDGGALWKAWFEECSHTHVHCKNEPQLMPTRLLLIQGSEELSLRLVSTSPGIQISYAALSYCWGGDQEYKTTKSNIRRYEETGISAEALAPFLTIVDAIEVTKTIGLSYIWIDSLCIVQDDDDDKGREIGKMQSIYAGADVTISAARAKTCRDGFLDVNTDENTNMDFSMDYPSIDGRMGSIFLTKDLFGYFGPQPIDTRAWTFQEYYLSPRVLAFEKLSVVWRCCTRTNQDGGQSEDRSSDAITTTRLSSLNRHRLCEEWMSFVKRYTQRRLTVQSDRLPGMSGFAARFASFEPSRYLAGIWEGYFARQMYWEVGRRIWEMSPTHNQGRDASRIPNQPSWSWASVDGDILYPQMRASISSHEVATMAFDSYEASLVSADAPYGGVRSAKLTVKARMKEAIWTRDAGLDLGRNQRGYDAYDTDKIENKFQYDIRNESKLVATCNGRVHCLEIWTRLCRESYGTKFYCESVGIVVIPTEEGLWRRVGTFRVATHLEPIGKGQDTEEVNKEDDDTEGSFPAFKWEERYWFVDCQQACFTLV